MGHKSDLKNGYAVFTMTKYLFFILFFFALIPNHLAYSQEEAEEKDDAIVYFDKFIRENKLFHNQLNIKSERMFRLTYPECQESVKLARVEPNILTKPIQRTGMEEDVNPNINLDGVPIFGQWIERVNVQGCDKTALINHLALAYPVDLPVLLPLVNGQTQLDPIDQPFALDSIALRLKKMPKPCDGQLFVINSMLAGFRDNSGTAIVNEDMGHGWFEQWNVRACGDVHTAMVVILPDAKTRYRYLARLR